MPPKAAIIQPILMAGVMAFLMTALITYLNLGFPPDYVARWIKAFVIAWPAAAVAAYIAIPIARRATGRIVGWLEAKGL
jgi:nucleoside permease NupC